MEKVKNLINLIELATDKTVIYLKKIGKLVNNKNTHDTVYIFTQIIITMLIIAILRIPFQIFNELGTFIIYAVGNTFRGVLSFSWELILELSYLMFSLFLLLKIFRNILKKVPHLVLLKVSMNYLLKQNNHKNYNFRRNEK